MSCGDLHRPCSVGNKNNDFDVKHKERFGTPKNFENEELEALLNEHLCQAQNESLGVDHTTVSKRSKPLGMIEKQGNKVTYELKPKDVERRFFFPNSCSNCRKGKVFCIVS